MFNRDKTAWGLVVNLNGALVADQGIVTPKSNGGQGIFDCLDEIVGVRLPGVPVRRFLAQPCLPVMLLRAWEEEDRPEPNRPQHRASGRVGAGDDHDASFPVVGVMGIVDLGHGTPAHLEDPGARAALGGGRAGNEKRDHATRTATVFQK